MDWKEFNAVIDKLPNPPGTNNKPGAPKRRKSKRAISKRVKKQHSSKATSTTKMVAASSSAASKTYTELRKLPSRAELKFDQEIFLKACKSQLQSDELQKVYWMLLDNASAPDQLKKSLDQVYTRLRQESMDAKNGHGTQRRGWKKMFGSSSKQPPIVTSNKAVLDFNLNGAQCPLNTPVTDVIEFHCSQGKAPFRFFRPKQMKSHQIRIEPIEGVFKKNHTLSVHFTLEVSTTLQLEEVIAMEIEGVGKQFFLINLRSEKSVFGVDPSELELVTDEQTQLQIPKVLYTLKNFLIKHDGLKSEGVFRLAPDENETLIVKAQLNKGEFTACEDINCVANLLKVWFRELPTQLLMTLDTEMLLNTETTEECLHVFSTLEEPNHTLMEWLLDLMAQTAAYQDINKMGPRNLAIVIAPNLFTSIDPNPLQALTFSQKVVNFVLLLVQHKLAQT